MRGDPREATRPTREWRGDGREKVVRMQAVFNYGVSKFSTMCININGARLLPIPWPVFSGHK